ncbi:unnamed protein product, partial [Gadus morhua 'NCC']
MGISTAEIAVSPPPQPFLQPGVPTARLRRQRRKNFDCHAEPGELAGLLRLLCTPSSENVNETSKLLTRARDKKRLAAETVTWNREEETPRRGVQEAWEGPATRYSGLRSNLFIMLAPPT